MSPLTYFVQPGGNLKGTIRVPGDKSISHRSIMLGALATGTTRISGFLEGEDAIATMNAFRAMGVQIEGPENGNVIVQGVGLRGLKAPQKVLDCGNSGTSMRLLSGLLAGQSFAATLTGDESLRKRPMNRVAIPLRQMGAQIATQDNGRPPLHITPTQNLAGIDYTMPMASAQVKSAVLLAGLFAEGQTCVTEPAPTRDHTERMLEAFGYAVSRSGSKVCVRGGGKLVGTTLSIPADTSSAAFFMVGAAIAPGSDVLLTQVGINPTRIGVIEILRLMGAVIEMQDVRLIGGEQVADIRVRHAPLHGISIPQELVPLAIDEFPALFIAAANADGETVLTGAEELRVKESDRIQVMADGLSAVGIEVSPTADGIRIRGGSYGGAVIDSHGDHRIAMSFAMAALGATGAIEIRDCANVATSFPGFSALAAQAGLQLAQHA